MIIAQHWFAELARHRPGNGAAPAEHGETKRARYLQAILRVPQIESRLNLKWIRARELFPIKRRFVPILPPVPNLAILDFYHSDAVHFASVFEREFASAELSTFIENEVVPRHFHGPLAAFGAAEEFEQRGAPAIKLFVRRLAVNGVVREATRCLLRVPLVPSVGQCLHESFKLGRVHLLRRRRHDCDCERGSGHGEREQVTPGAAAGEDCLQ